MPRYYLKLGDGYIVSDFGVHELEDAKAARSAVIDLARSVREVRPDVVGQHCSISVTGEDGAEIAPFH
jgi:hypothetical protein